MGISALLAAQILDASATGRSVLTGADASAIRTTLGLGTLATQSATITDYLTIASAASTYQPLDSDLTSIAALSTTAFGRGLLTEASASTARSTLGLGTLATQSPTGTPSASTFLRGDFSWQTIDLSGYVPYSGATGAVNLGANALTAGAGTFSGVLQVSAGTASVPAIRSVNAGTGVFFRNSGTQLAFTTNTNIFGTINNDNGLNFNLASNALFGWSSGSPESFFQDVVLLRDSAATLGIRNGTNAQAFRVYGIFTDASNYERAKIAWESNVLRIGTEKAGTGSARALEFQTDGTTRLTIGTDGTITSANTLVLADTSLILQLGSNSGTQVRRAASSQNVMLRSSSITTMQGSAVSQIGATRGLLLGDVDYSDCYVSTGGFGGDIYIAPNVMGNSSRNGGNLRLFGGAASSVGNWNGGHVYLDGGALNGTGVNGSFIIGSVRSTLTCFGGTTSSFPAIKRNAAALNFRLADDSADCDITAAHGTFSAGTDTVSNPILNLSQTWNSAATTFTGILSNVTDTASNANSLLMDLQVGGVSKASISKGGAIQIQSVNYQDANILYFGRHTAGIPKMFGFDSYQGFRVAGGAWIAWSNSTYDSSQTLDLYLYRDAANTLAQRNSTNAQTFRVYNLFTDASNYERAKIAWESNVLRIGTEKAGTGSARALELQTDGVTRLTIASGGTCTFSSFLQCDASAQVRSTVGIDNTYLYAKNIYLASTLYGNGSVLFSPESGVIRVCGNNSTTNGGSVELVEQTAPSAPAANSVRIYAEDNGSGKTRLMALFATGVAQQIAIEP